jgi:dipeptidase D
VLGDKNRALCMVSTGPDILDPHSLDERAPLEGLPRYVRLLAGALDRLSP